MKLWNDIKKITARDETIIKIYRQLFGSKLPKSKQYWTICGQCTDNEGNFLNNCELDQLLKSGLIEPDQFHGVDNVKHIIDANKKAFPNTNWYNKDFLIALNEYPDEQFNPGIVNADLIYMPKNACEILSKVLFRCRNINNIVVIGNIVLEYQALKTRSSNMEEVIKFLDNNLFFDKCRSSWEMMDTYGEYDGTGRDSRSLMGSAIFYRK